MTNSKSSFAIVRLIHYRGQMSGQITVKTLNEKVYGKTSDADADFEYLRDCLEEELILEGYTWDQRFKTYRTQYWNLDDSSEVTMTEIALVEMKMSPFL